MLVLLQVLLLHEIELSHEIEQLLKFVITLSILRLKDLYNFLLVLRYNILSKGLKPVLGILFRLIAFCLVDYDGTLVAFEF